MVGEGRLSEVKDEVVLDLPLMENGASPGTRLQGIAVLQP
jgi:hypothetical protein